MSGYDTHHADLAQTAGVETWVEFFGTVAWVAAIVLVSYGAYFVLAIAFTHYHYRRYDRDHARQQMHADRTQGETFPERVQRINGEKR